MEAEHPSESVLVLGGGVAGLQSAIDLAKLGFFVHLVERSPSIGGRMAQLDKTFPTNDCSMCILAPKMIECAGHPRVTLHTYSELVSLGGSLGCFEAVIRHRSRFVDEAKCTGCGDCALACPMEVESKFEVGLARHRAVYRPFVQAVPNVYTIIKNGHAPCRDRCPAGINAQGYVQLIQHGKLDEALGLIHETMPFAGTLGRICPRPCETACTRSEVESPVAIAALKRAAADLGRHEVAAAVDEKTRRRRARRAIAVVGAGPAGLTAAYNLARRGYPVTIFEKLPVAGGMLRVGVPSYRLPREVLEREIDLVRRLGVKIKTSCAVRGPSGIRDLFKQGFKAVFLATGAHASLKLGVPGESLRGVLGAVELLRRVSLAQRVSLGKSAVVVGGGNAAIDAARTLRRLKIREVTILYRRTRTEMPALPWEVEAALAEGVQLVTLAAPVRIIGGRGRVVALEAIRMRLGDLDASGRRRPIPLEGSSFVCDCDMVVPAISQAPVLDYLGPRSRVKTTSWGTIVVDSPSGTTGLRGVFAGGDVVSGPATAVEAVAAANRAAEAIHRFFEDARQIRDFPTEGKPFGPLGEPDGQIPCVRPSPKSLAAEPQRERIAMPERSVKNRLRSFGEVELGYDRQQAMLEAARCLGCASCCECRECERACQADAVDHEMRDELISLQVGACVVATGFEVMDPASIPEYGFGRIANVVTGLQLERLLSASGPTCGHVRRPSDDRPPKRLAFIQCVGSRDVRNHAYCSAVCCMHATKEAILAHEHDPELRSTVFYMDLRAAGKTFQDYVARARQQYAVTYLRARPARVEQVDGSEDVRVVYEDTESRVRRQEIFDLVVLCQAMIPSDGTAKLARVLGVELDEHCFVRVPHPLTAPVDTTVPGLLAAGYATGPKDIPDSVVEASAAAARVAELLPKTRRAGDQ